MKIGMNKFNGILIALFLVFLLGEACKKTDSYYHQLADTPEIYTALNLDYSTDRRGDTRQYHVGDTLRINGRFNADPAQIKVQIGGANAPVIDVLKTDKIVNQNQVTSYNTVETIRVVLSDAMGTGRLPVKLNCRGYDLTGPPVFLIPKGNVAPVSDTLVWKEFFHFPAYSNYQTLPNLVDSFMSNPVFYPSYSGNGNIFFSVKTRIQLLHPDGTISPVTDLQNLSDAQGSFRIVKMYNGAVDQQEHTLYFSAMTSDSYKSPGTNGGAIDADSNWIFRFCKLDLQSKQLQVMNRTIFPFYKKNYNALGTPPQIQAAYAGEGQVSQVNMLPFSAVWANDRGEVYFTPVGVALSDWDFNITGKASMYPPIFVYYGSISSYSRNYFGKITPDGQVQYLMKTKSDWPGDGLNAYLRSRILSLDPVKGIMFTSLRLNNYQTVLYDLNSRSTMAKLFPTTPGAGAVGPFSLLDPMSPAGYTAGADENGSYLSLPGPSARYLFDYANIVYDFTANQAYRYAPVIIDSAKYLIPSDVYDGDKVPSSPGRADLPAAVLNYDQQGNLYKIAYFYRKQTQVFYDIRRTYILKH